MKLCRQYIVYGRRKTDGKYGWAYLVLTLCAAVVSLGCGEDGPKMATVSGTVNYKGQPLKKGKIQFEPESGRTAYGEIVEGQIKNVKTYEPGDGAVVGTHRVSIYAFVRDPVGMEIVPSMIPERYNDPSTSGVTEVIESGSKNELQIELTD